MPHECVEMTPGYGCLHFFGIFQMNITKCYYPINGACGNGITNPGEENLELKSPCPVDLGCHKIF